MVEIARCKCGADGRLSTGEMYASVDCSRKLCWRGPIRRTGAEAIAAWNALMSPAAPEPAIVHYEHAIGATIQQMQEAFQKTEMWKRGDARLVWVNEGDLGMASPAWWMSSEEIRTILRPAAPAPEPAAKLPKGFNQAALAEMIEKGFRLRGSYGPNPLKDMAEHAAQIVLSRIAVNATLAGAAAPEPAAGAVRVRIQVRYVQGQIQISYLRDQDGEELNFDEHGADKIVWITADIPLPQPTEIRGTVESGE